MSEEELEDLLSIGCCRYHEEIGKKAKKEIERLKDRIDKAIDYLENTPRIVKTLHYRDKESNFAFIENEVKGELLEILKGSDKE